MAKIRTFIAVNLPQEIKTQIGESLEKIKKKIKGEIKWVKADNFHFTFHFLGYLDEERLEKVRKILSETVKNVHVVKIKITGFSVFPNPRQPRVLFLKGREEGTVLADLQKDIGKKLKQINLEIDYRPWQMHLTFGRVRNKIIFPQLILKENLKFEFEVSSIDLMKSDLRITGPIYTVLNSYPLK